MLEDEPTTPSVPQAAEAQTAAAAPKRSRRRSASRPAGPPAEAPGAPAPAAGPEPSEPAPAKKTARRTTKKAPAEPADTGAGSSTAAATAEATAAPSETPKKTAKKTQKKKVGAASSEAVAPEEPAAGDKPARRSRKKAEATPPPVLFQAPDTAVAVEVAERAAVAVPDAGATAEDEDESSSTSRRRRRRGGRGRKGRSGAADAVGSEAAASVAAESDVEQPEPEEAPADSDAAEEGDEAGSTTTRRRRRRRRRGGSSDDEANLTPDDPERTVVHVRQPRSKSKDGKDAPSGDSITSVKGSTRLEAKKQRRREGREQGRRRPPVLTEAEFLARREAVDRIMVVRQVGERTQIAVLEDGVLVEHYVARASSSTMVGNVYLGRVQNVLPSMEAAFVEIGRGRNAVLYAGEVNWDAAGLDGQPKRIEHAMKSGDAVLVQVTKDPIGHKGARLTAQVSLPGRYLVYVPDGSMTGISRKLPDNERSRLKGILKRIVPDDAGVIVRTAAEGASEEELQRDVTRLSAQWADIETKAKTANAPALLYEEPDLTIRVVRDVFNEDFSRLIVSGADAWDTVDTYVRHVAPDLADRLQRWTDNEDVFAAHRVDEQLAKALDRKVWLPSGGYLIIDSTEAMVVVDVNTGKFTGQGGNLEETVTKNNIEAAEEIVRQLRLRDIGGIVVIDFIDMVLESNRELVLRRLLECLGRDRTKHQVAEVTSLGLVQMTRKRVGQGLLDAFSRVCDSCNGRGRHVHLEPVEPKRDGKRDGGDGARETKRAEPRRTSKRAAKAVPEAGADEATKAALAALAKATTGAKAAAGSGEAVTPSEAAPEAQDATETAVVDQPLPDPEPATTPV